MTEKKKVLLISGQADSPNEFFVPTKDHQGHDAKFQCRIHPGLTRDAAELLAKAKERGIPWKTQDDADRYIVKCGLEVAFERIEAQRPSSTTALDRYMQNMAMELEQAQSDHILATTRKSIENLTRIGAYDRIRENVLDGWRALNALGYPHWRRHFLCEYEREFGSWLPKQVSLNPKDTTDEQ